MFLILVIIQRNSTVFLCLNLEFLLEKNFEKLFKLETQKDSGPTFESLSIFINAQGFKSRATILLSIYNYLLFFFGDRYKFTRKWDFIINNDD